MSDINAGFGEPAATYPETPGFKEKGATSEEAAKGIKPKAPTLRYLVLLAARTFPDGCTADEIADALCMSPFNIRPRCTELVQFRFLEKTLGRKPNASGARAAVLRVTERGMKEYPP